MEKCKVSLARELFGKGETEREIFRGGERTGPLIDLFYPSISPTLKWRDAASTIEVLTRRLPP
eukprot:12914844-Alexandrium_andersonii.AAC.1